MSKLIRRAAFTALVIAAFIAFGMTIEDSLNYAGESAQQFYGIALIVLTVMLAVGVIRALWAVRRATADLAAFEGPYLQFRDQERARHQQAMVEWEQAVRHHRAQAEQAATTASRVRSGPLWYPVYPASEPVRLDVLGGDPRRHGWDSLLVTVGTSALTAGHGVTVLDLTGQDVGGTLVRIAQAGGRSAHMVELRVGGDDVDLLGSIPSSEMAEGISQAVNGAASEHRHERALMTQVLDWVVGSLDGPATFGRLAAGVQVLRQGAPSEALTPGETNRLHDHLGDLDQNEWTARQLRYLVSQLHALESVAAGRAGSLPLWTAHDVLRIASAGGRDDRRELLDRLLLQLAQRGMSRSRPRGEILVVAGADSLGAETLRTFSEHARQVGTRLILMIAQPQGDLEATAGTGGAVCIMKMYNHRDAAIAAEFVGRGYKFVLNQVTRQVGKTFTDGGGDSFGVNTGVGTNMNRAGRASLSDSRGQAWTGVRNWSASDNSSFSTAAGRVYEFVVEPQEIMDMPETAFLLVDNSGQGRRVTMADGNPGICLLDRVSATPL